MSQTVVLSGIILAFALFALVLAWADYITASPKRAAKSADYKEPPRALAASSH